VNSPTTRPPRPVRHWERIKPVRAEPVACSVRLVWGETEAAVLASFEVETSASCSERRRASWVSAKWGIGIEIGGGISVGASVIILGG
jgi:hypothetical protein